MPPENASYFHAAYVVTVAVYALYAVSLWRRRRALDRRAREAELGARR
jgi:heme exporter protein D